MVNICDDSGPLARLLLTRSRSVSVVEISSGFTPLSSAEGHIMASKSNVETNLWDVRNSFLGEPAALPRVGATVMTFL